jgi:predicted NAD-dependent protein-ADP-ribosyltransferase YbiA (DUF1768 family)
MGPLSSVEELLTVLASGQRMDYLFFWGHQPEPDGRVGRGCLSQWWPVAFTEGRDTYASAEHYMMAGKARLFGDERVRDRILACSTPAEAKRLGRQVRGFDDRAWAAVRFDLVVAASPQDRIWGIGMAASDPGVEEPTSWRGLNLLGFALTHARERLRQR